MAHASAKVERFMEFLLKGDIGQQKRMPGVLGREERNCLSSGGTFWLRMRNDDGYAKTGAVELSRKEVKGRHARAGQSHSPDLV